MSEEEKKAIEIIKKEITKPETTPLEVYVTDIKMLLYIIDKQQKEIEELKEENAEHIEAITEWVNGERINDIKHISKDKIREHLKRFEEIEKEFIFIDNKSTAREINKALIEFSKRLLEE